jgi:hypothetical protein
MTVEERLKKMEMKVKLNNCILLIVVILIVLTITLGADYLKNVTESRGFKVIDENGKTSAILNREGPSLTLFDKNGKSRLMLDVYHSDDHFNGEDGVTPRLCMRDEGGKDRIGLWVDSDVPMLGLYDKNGKARILMSVLKDEPVLQLCDPNGKVIWEAPRSGL